MIVGSRVKTVSEKCWFIRSVSGVTFGPWQRDLRIILSLCEVLVYLFSFLGNIRPMTVVIIALRLSLCEVLVYLFLLSARFIAPVCPGGSKFCHGKQ